MRSQSRGMWVSDLAIKRTPAAGEYDPNVSDAHVCSRGYNPRPGVGVSGPLKDRALRGYRLPKSESTRREADHLYPRWLGGATALSNFWPEPNFPHARGFILNPKDRLESALFQRTCKRHTMTVARARRVFQGDWRSAYKRYVNARWLPEAQRVVAASKPNGLAKARRSLLIGLDPRDRSPIVTKPQRLPADVVA